jgi:hypothetical protein
MRGFSYGRIGRPPPPHGPKYDRVAACFAQAGVTFGNGGGACSGRQNLVAVVYVKLAIFALIYHYGSL